MSKVTDWTDAWADRAVARGLRRGSRRAWDRFYACYASPIYRFALSKTGAPDVAEDVAHDTIVAVVEGIGRYKASRGSLWNWVCGIAMNTIREYRRRDARDERIREQIQQFPQLPDPIEDGVAAEQVFPVLAALHPRHQEVLALKYLEGLGVNTIAARLGCGAKAVESRLTRAREAFRREHSVQQQDWVKEDDHD